MRKCTMHVQMLKGLRNYFTGEVVIGKTKYNDRHVRYSARQKTTESERNRELHRVRQFHNFMIDHDFVKSPFMKWKDIARRILKSGEKR